MATSAEKFWSDQQAAAVLKHRILRAQLAAFAGKVGSFSAGGRIAYLDGYAGPGVYGDGAPGSPALAVEVAQHLASIGRTIEGRFIEKRRDYSTRLATMLSDQGFSDWRVYQGECKERLGEVLESVQTLPLLAFLDPFGLGVPFDVLVDRLLRRPKNGRPRTEILANFSVSALLRLSGFLDKDYDQLKEGLPRSVDLFGDLDEEAGRTPEDIARDKRLQRQILDGLDEFLGGSWWRPIRSTRQTGWLQQILDQWLTLMCEAVPGWQAVAVGVPETYGGPPAYYLVLLTQSDSGMWAFNESVSLAFEHMHKASWRVGEQSPSLFDEPGHADPSEEWIHELTDRVRALVLAGHTGPCASFTQEIYGPLFGRARETHLRKALQNLHGTVLGGDPPRGKLERYVLRQR